MLFVVVFESDYGSNLSVLGSIVSLSRRNIVSLFAAVLCVFFVVLEFVLYTIQ